MKNGLVNIFIASYNRAEYLQQSLKSVLAQTYKNFHILIVDDASTDGAPDLAGSYARKYPELVTAICKRKNRGVGDSVNRALQIAKSGEFFAFHADDDLWEPSKLEKQMAIFKQFPEIGMVHTSAQLIDAEGNAINCLFSDLHGITNSNIAKHILLHGNFICGASVVVRTKVLQLFNFRLPHEVNWLSDLFMWLVISSQFKVHYIKEPLVSYRISTSSVSKTMADAMRWETYLVKKLAYKQFPVLRKLASLNEVKTHFGKMLLNWFISSFQRGAYRWSLRFLFEALVQKPDLVILGLRKIPSYFGRLFDRRCF